MKVPGADLKRNMSKFEFRPTDQIFFSVQLTGKVSVLKKSWPVLSANAFALIDPCAPTESIVALLSVLHTWGMENESVCSHLDEELMRLIGTYAGTTVPRTVHCVGNSNP